MSKPKIRKGDGVLYYIEKNKCSVMEWAVVTKVKTYKRWRTEYIIETTDGLVIKTWRNFLKKASKGSSKNIPKAEFDTIKAELTEMEKRITEQMFPDGDVLAAK